MRCTGVFAACAAAWGAGPFGREEGFVSTSAFDTFAREAASGVSRRGSLLTIGGAALAAGVTNAGVSVAKKKKTCKKKQNQRCNNDAAGCRAQVPAACNNNPECVAEASLCCDTCSANGFLTCLIAASAASASVARLK